MLKLKNIFRYYVYFFLAATCSLFIFGSTKAFDTYTLPISIVNIFILVTSWLIQGKKIILPKYFYIYLIFLIVLFVHTKIFNAKFTFPLILLSGGAYWVVFYNLRDFVSKYYFRFLILFGLSISGIYFTALSLGLHYSNPNNIFLPLGIGVLHNHLGDLWAIITVGTLYFTSKKYSKWYVILIILGILMIALSFSRSAIVTLAFGIAYIIDTKDRSIFTKKWLIPTLIGLSILFLFFGSFKTILFSRPYFVETIEFLLKRPLGAGISNFYKVSPESSVAHNIILEMLSGISVFSVIFVIWLAKVIVSFKKDNSKILYQALFLSLFVNFFFDTTYTIPSMLWIWFITLAFCV